MTIANKKIELQYGFCEKYETTFISHNFHVITDPWKLIVTLKGEAKDIQSNRPGIYILGPNVVNGKSHWLQDTGANAIWHDKEVETWKIGYKDDLGSSLAGIQSTDDLGGPQDVKTWKYYTGVKWITSDDILVDTLVEPGT